MSLVGKYYSSTISGLFFVGEIFIINLTSVEVA